MAIYSLHHSHVGKSTQAQPGTAGAHVGYITRESAAPLVLGENMPLDRDAARAWMDEREATDRKNGRVIDKLMVALPVELDTVQRADLVRAFVAEIGGERISWMAGIHDKGEDRHNPHAHIIIRDKDIDTGKRVIGTSEKGSTERFREAWEVATNRALERAGWDTRIDRRSLEEQGIAREAGIHVGPNVLAMEDRGLRPISIAQELETGRVINWPEIDQGRTRADRQREIEAGNLERERDGQRDKSGDRTAGLAPAVEIAPEPEPYVPNFVLVQDPPRSQVYQPDDALPRMSEIDTRRAQEPVIETERAKGAPTTLEASPGRWAGIVAIARERLLALGDSLEGVFTRLRDQVLRPEPQVRPIPEPDLSYIGGRASMPDRGGGGGMGRAPESGPVNASLAAGLKPEPRPAPQPDEPRAREIQRQIETGRKAEAYDREAMHGLAREHHALKGAAPEIAPTAKRPPAAEISNRPGAAESEKSKGDQLRQVLNPYRHHTGPEMDGLEL